MPELRNIDWRKLLGSLKEEPAWSALIKSRSLQWALTIALRQQGMMILDDLEGLVLEYKGLRYTTDLISYPRIFEAYHRYRIQDIQAGDCVLDLGANVGSFTIPAAAVADKVVAYEPNYDFRRHLYENLQLNNLEKRVDVFDLAVSPLSRLHIDCQEQWTHADGKTFAEIKEEVLEVVSPSIDFLRMDIGGEEWSIHPWELGDIGNVEIEFHFWKGQKDNWPVWRDWFVHQKYSYLARWSKHKHWLYLSAWKDGLENQEEVHLPDGSFKGESLRLWRGSEA